MFVPKNKCRPLIANLYTFLEASDPKREIVKLYALFKTQDPEKHILFSGTYPFRPKKKGIIILLWETAYLPLP